MVSKASEDLPDPDRPVMTTSWSRGRSTSIFFRLWTRAPRTAIQSWAISTVGNSGRNPNSYFSRLRCLSGGAALQVSLIPRWCRPLSGRFRVAPTFRSANRDLRLSSDAALLEAVDEIEDQPDR